MVDILEPKHNHSHQSLEKQEKPTLREIRNLSSDEVSGDWYVNRGKSEIKEKYKESIQTQRDSLSELDIEAAIAFGSIREILEEVDLRPLGEELQALRESLDRVHGQGMNRAVDDLARYETDIPHTPQAPTAQKWVEGRVNNIRENIDRSTRKGIIRVIEYGRVNDLSEEQILRDIRNVIGLTEREVNAVFNFREQIQNGNKDAAGRLLDASEQQKARKLAEQETTNQDELEALSLSYADHLLNNRADRLADHEANTAFNMGVMNQIREPEVQTLIASVTIGKVWVSAMDERVCSWCSQLHGQTLAILDTFQADVPYSQQSGVKRMSALAPSIHPACRCKIVIRPI